MCDETGLPLDHSPKSGVTLKGQKHAQVLTSGQKKQITVLACGNAAGYVIPPLVIFSRKTLNPELTVQEVPGTMYGLSDSGWMTSDIFENWFTHQSSSIFSVPEVQAQALKIILKHQAFFTSTSLKNA